jgi:hypothetical protein
VAFLFTKVHFSEITIILIPFLLKQNSTNAVQKNSLQADSNNYMQAVDGNVSRPPNLPSQVAPRPLVGLPQVTFTSKHTSTRLDPTQIKVLLDVTTSRRTQDIVTCVCNSHTTPRSTSAAVVLLLDCTSYDGMRGTANSESWVKKGNFFNL